MLIFVDYILCINYIYMCAHRVYFEASLVTNTNKANQLRDLRDQALSRDTTQSFYSHANTQTVKLLLNCIMLLILLSILNHEVSD